MVTNEEIWAEVSQDQYLATEEDNNGSVSHKGKTLYLNMAGMMRLRMMMEDWYGQ